MPHPILANGTHIQDFALFKKLGLERFENVPHGKQHEVGVVDDHGSEYDYHVAISVRCIPAQFWHFSIVLHKDDVEHQRIELSTGSGALSDYWPTIELLLDNMLVIKHATDPK